MSRRRVYDTAAWRAIRPVVLERDGYRCQIGGPRCTGIATDVDHIVCLADGGEPYDPSNLRGACKKCNDARAAHRTNAARRAGGNRRPW